VSSGICEDCPFWKHFPVGRNRVNADFGECRRHPPVGRHEEGLVTVGYPGYWPTTDSEDFCGEHPDNRDDYPLVYDEDSDTLRYPKKEDS
jgi:hypothetical protein